MSGGDRSFDSSGYGGGYGQSAFDCDTVALEIRLSSVIPAVVSTLKLQDELIIALENNSVVAKTSTGSIVGSIASGEVVELIKCIKSGKTYIGIVIELLNGLCKIKLFKK